MSHTWKVNETTFIGNSDLSGDITIINNHSEINVPGKDLIVFIRRHLLREHAEKIEQEVDQLLNRLPERKAAIYVRTEIEVTYAIQGYQATALHYRKDETATIGECRRFPMLGGISNNKMENWTLARNLAKEFGLPEPSAVEFHGGNEARNVMPFLVVKCDGRNHIDQDAI